MINARKFKLRSILHEESKEDQDYYRDVISNVKLPIEQDNILVFIESGGTEGLFLDTVVPYLKENTYHIYLLLLPYHNSLAASLEIKSYLANHYPCIEVTLLFGSLDDINKQLSTDKPVNNTSDGIYTLRKHFNLKKRLGVIGKPSDWLIASNVNYEVAKNKLGVSLIDISAKEIEETIEKTDYLSVIYEHHDILKYTSRVISSKMKESIRILGALLTLVRKYHLDGLTIRCFDLLSRFKATSCFALAYLNDHRIISSCEGDIPSLLTMVLLNHYTGKPSFQANPSKFLYQEHSLILAHCSVPFSMCEKYEYLSHFESRLGIAIQGKLPDGRAYLCKLDNKLEHLLCIPGEVVRDLYSSKRCRTQIEYKTNEQCFNALLLANVQNHLIITYDDITNLISDL